MIRTGAAWLRSGMTVVQTGLCRLGADVAERGLPVTAFHVFRVLAIQGHCEGQCRVGLAYEQGSGVPRNEILAAVWYRRAALRGHGEAQYRLGGLYASGLGVMQDEAQAWHWRGRARARGYVAMQV